METILGFVAGYLTGAREGREGLERLRESWRGIRNSPEARKLAADAMGIAELAVRRTAAGRLSGTASGVSGLIIRRLAGGHQDKRAA
jgi:sigma54-dependent transcription regulator